MQKAYNRINWENYPSTETAVNATNLNLVDYGLNEVDNRVIELDITKANQTDLLNSVASVTFNSTTGILTVTLNNGTVTQIDTGLAKLAVNFDYDEDPTSPHYQQLILQMKDGTYKYIDLSAMITQFEFDNTSTVVFNVDSQTGHISAIIPNGSITAEKLNPNVIVTMQTIEDAAKADALKSEGHAVGKQNGVPVGPESPYYHNNAQYYAEQAQGGGSGGHVIKNETDTFIQRTGLKFVGKVSVEDDETGDNTVVTVEAGGAVPHLIVISETGSTVTATKGTTVISATETSSEHFECDLEMDDPQDIYGVWIIDAVLAGDDAQVSLNVDTIKVYTVDDSHFHADITVTYPNGATVSCSKSGEQTMYATGSPYTFTVHSAGVWTITGTRNSITETQTVTINATGQTESVTLTILPDGSTVTPTDDVQILLKCADIWDKTSYTTIADLIADDTSLLTVLTNDNAIDYLVRSTTFASAITADEDAMAMIGSYDYASETLLNDSTWSKSIVNSTYVDSVITYKVPTMTSATAPEGEVFYTGTLPSQTYKPFNVFNTSGGCLWSGAPFTVGYQFTKAVKIYCFTLDTTYASGTNRLADYLIQGSDDRDNWTDLYSATAPDSEEGSHQFGVLPHTNAYKAFRINGLTARPAQTSNTGVTKLQFYGRENGGVQSWLKAGGITDKDYTTLAEVLADTTTLSALIADTDAVDYLVTAKGLIDGIVADATAMSYIGLNNYCADTLLSDADWLNAICNSTYMESVLNVKVPTMTSNTTPNGECFGSSLDTAGDVAYWKAFNNSRTGYWASNRNQSAPQYVGYNFGRPVKVKLVSTSTYTASSTYVDMNVTIQGSNDGTNWTDIDDIIAPASTDTTFHTIDNETEYEQYRFYCLNENYTAYSGSCQFYIANFYCREDV